MSALADQFRALEFGVMTAAGKGDADAVASLLTEDFFEIGASGCTYNKAEVLAVIRETPAREFAVEDFRVRQLGPDHILVSYRATARSAAGTSSAYRSTLWLRRGRDWKIAFHQATVIPA